MKKVFFITRHFIVNYGSFLQTLAFKEVCKNIGRQAIVIDYISKEESPINSAKVWKKKNNKNIVFAIIYFFVATIPFCISYSRMRKKFSKYIEKTEKFKTIQQLNKHDFHDGILCSGSDQLWGKMALSDYDPAYFLTFNQSCKKIAYSSSFGSCEFEKHSKIYVEMLSKYSSIGVREKTAQDFLSANGIKSELVLDPTFLLDKEYWDSYIKKIKRKDYILVYQLHKNKAHERFALELSKRYGLQLVRVCPNILHFIKPGHFVYTTNPFKFLSLLNGAKYVITDSFHCTAFSIIFEKQFCVVAPNKTKTRIENILDLCRIENRIIDMMDYNVFDQVIDYSSTGKVLDEYRKKSIDYLCKAVNVD